MSYQDTIAVIERSKLASADKARVTELLKLITKSSADMSAFELKLARVAAGLSVGQAARLLKMTPAELVGIESGWVGGKGAVDAVVQDFDRAYGLDPEGRK